MDLSDIKYIMKALIVSCPRNTYSTNELLSDFKNETGTPVPRFGYNTEIEFLESFTDTAKIEGKHPSDRVVVNQEKESHIHALVKGFCRSAHLNYTEMELNAALEDDYEISRIIYSNLEEEDRIEESPYSIYDNNASNQYLRCTSCIPFNESKIMNFSPDMLEHMGIEQRALMDYRKINLMKKSEPDKFDLEIASDVTFVNNNITYKLKTLMSEQSSGIWCCDLPEMYQQRYNSTFDYRNFGYRSLIDMVTDHPDIFRCVRPDKGDWLLFDANKPESQDELEIKEKSLYKIPEDVQDKIEEMLIEYCKTNDGIYIDDFLCQYYIKYKEKLKFRDFGFSSLKCTLASLENHVIQIDKSTIRWLIKPIVTVSETPVPHISAIPPILPNDRNFFDLFPNDVVLPTERFNEVDIEKHIISNNNKLFVTVAEVWTPEKFYIQLRIFNELLDEIMRDLQDFYTLYSHKYNMPYQTIQVNQICAALHKPCPGGQDEWNRAIINRIIDEKYVMVTLVDFGTSICKEKSSLKFLHVAFLHLPIQAFRASLSGIKPVDNIRWTLPASQKFLEYVTQTQFVEFIVNDADYKTSKCLWGEIICTINGRNMNINCALVREGYAEYCDDRFKKKRSNSYEKFTNRQIGKHSAAHSSKTKLDEGNQESEKENASKTTESSIEKNVISVDCDLALAERIRKKYESQYPFENKICMLSFLILTTEEKVKKVAREDFDKGLKMAKELGTVLSLYEPKKSFPTGPYIHELDPFDYSYKLSNNSKCRGRQRSEAKGDTNYDGRKDADKQSKI